MPHSTIRTELMLPNQESILHLARNYVRELSSLADLPDEQAQAMVQAAGEACANVIDHAFAPGESGTFTVIGEIKPTELAISVCDQGMPFAATITPDGSLPRDNSPARISASGGLSMIAKAVDKAQWINHGRSGKELRLVKYRPDTDVREEAEQEQLAQFKSDEPLAPEQEYTIRRLQPDDAVGVARIIYRTYGYTYLHEDCYHPERLARLNETGELVSIVAVDASGEVVGHYALERPGMTKVAERGMAVVSPAHRGRDLMQRMRVCLEEEARRVGLIGSYSQAVTHHTYSQRVNEEFGSHVCGIILAGSPRTLVFKQWKSEELPQRISWVIYYDYVTPPAPAVVYAPAHHREILQRIYAGVGASVEFAEPPAGDNAPDEYGEISVSYDPGMDSGMIRVKKVGADSDVEVRRARRDLCEVAGAEAVYLHLPLSQPGTPELCRAVEEEGFFFSGLGPQFAADGDVLVLQFLNVEPFDTGLVKLASPFAQELLEYMAGERERVAKLGKA
ncbi:MAG: ATP-binding protein [Armatimonadota bacterium]|nr:ATP-binding protein [Armatimonadota bacterium]